MALPHIVRPDSVTVIVGGEVLRFATNHQNYKELVKAIDADDSQYVQETLKPVVSIQKHLVGNVAGFECDGNTVKYNGEDLPQAIGTRMLWMIQNGHNVSNLQKFFLNLQKNPSFRAVRELFGFLDACDLPITDDGYFLAYKKVRANFKDCHSGTFDNSPGKVCEVPRNTVDEDCNRTCSSGLHVCSVSYLSAFGGEKIVMCKINPADVVAVPTDYKNAKMRVCRYEVLQEVAEGNITPMYAAGNNVTAAPRGAEAPVVLQDNATVAKPNLVQQDEIPFVTGEYDGRGNWQWY